MGERIVTLLPSATEIVCSLGLQDRLVGVTHECDYPAGVEQLPHVTRSVIDHNRGSREIDTAVREHLETSAALYTLDVPLLQQLEPDLIVTQALCDVCAVSEHEVQQVLSSLPGSPRLINLEPMTLGEVFDTIDLVGAAAGIQATAKQYRAELESRVARIRRATSVLDESSKPRVGFLEWVDPLFNGGHWTPELIEYAGGIDCFGAKHQPSTTIADEVLMSADPDHLVIALCGFDEARARQELPALTSRIAFDELKAVRDGNVHILDGDSYFSRPGPRLVDALELVVDLLHPGLCSAT